LDNVSTIHLYFLHPVLPFVYSPADPACPPSTRTVYALLIINKAGGLVYNRDFSAPPNPSVEKISTNDYLVLAGTFHGVHAITKSLTPRIPVNNPNSSSRPNSNPNASTLTSLDNKAPSTATTTFTTPNPHVPVTGIETLETSFFRLSCFQTHTGSKFLLITDPLMPNVDAIMKGVYERYADHVMKNPFYQLEMPVRIEGWDRAVGQWLGGR
jgi:trafficking protein particle complex subunit 4